MCEHEEFKSNVTISRLTTPNSGVEGYAADIKICCTQCGVDFAFVGVAPGYSPFEPRVSIDSTELRVPITPATGQLVFEKGENLN